jgi:hypothetical protein
MLPKKEAGMVPLAAEILTEEVSEDGRTAVRRSLRLGVRAHTAGEVAMALIINISETGLLVETAVPLAVGELLRLDLPEASASTARVVWRVKLQAGCEFVNSIPKAALSAALLASPPPPEGGQPRGSPDQPITYNGPSEEDATRAVLIILCSVTFLAFLILLAAVLPILCGGTCFQPSSLTVT